MADLKTSPGWKTGGRHYVAAGYWCDFAVEHCPGFRGPGCEANKREGDRRVAVGAFDDRHPADQCDHPNCVRETSTRPDRRKLA